MRVLQNKTQDCHRSQQSHVQVCTPPPAAQQGLRWTPGQLGAQDGGSPVPTHGERGKQMAPDPAAGHHSAGQHGPPLGHDTQQQEPGTERETVSDGTSGSPKVADQSQMGEWLVHWARAEEEMVSSQC